MTVNIPARTAGPREIYGSNPNGDSVAVPVDATGRLAIDVPMTAFGQIATSTLYPVAQHDATLGLRARDLETFTGGGGTAEVANTGSGREFHCLSTSTIGSYGLIRSKRIAKYRAGQGILLSFGCRFGTPVAGSAMRIGGILSGVELSVGYFHDYGVTNGDLNPGILWRQGGELETQRLTITSGSAGGGENITITLNGSATVVAVSGSLSTTGVAQELAAASYTGWQAYQNGATVIFVNDSLGVNAGAFSFATDGSAAGSFTQLQAGTAATDTWITQADWSIDKLDPSLGANPSGMTLDMSKGNVWLIDVQAGYGTITFYIENPASGRFTPVHQISAANTRETPNLSQPSFKVGLFAASLGTTTPVECWVSDMVSFLEGIPRQVRAKYGRVASKTGIGTTLTPVLSIRVRPEFNGYVNLTEIQIGSFSAALDGTKPGDVQLIGDGTLTGADWTYHDQDGSAVEYDTSATAISGGEVIDAIALDKAGSFRVPLDREVVFAQRAEIITIAVRATSGTTDTVCHLGWTED